MYILFSDYSIRSSSFPTVTRLGIQIEAINEEPFIFPGSNRVSFRLRSHLESITIFRYFYLRWLLNIKFSRIWRPATFVSRKSICNKYIYLFGVHNLAFDFDLIRCYVMESIEHICLNTLPISSSPFYNYHKLINSVPNN